MSTTRLPQLLPLDPAPSMELSQFRKGERAVSVMACENYAKLYAHAYGLAVWKAAMEAGAQAAATALDMKEEARAEAQTRTANGMDDELRALRHYSTVSTYNAGVRRSVSAIRSLPVPEQGGPQ